MALSPEKPALQKPGLKVLLCSPRGFCAGVVRAIESVERALALYGRSVYVRHEIVHNRYVVERLRAKGAIFVEELDEVPDTGVPVVFSAHGVARAVPEEAARRNLFTLDATCPLVTKVQRAADIDWNEFGSIARLGITAGASAPEVLVEEIIEAFAARYAVSVETVAAAEEGVFFPLPRPLRENQAAE